MTRIPIVNEQDEIIGYKERFEAGSDGIRRITNLFVFNPRGDFLLAQRQLSKEIDAGKWGVSVAGTVDEGETYDSNVIKEAQEEIGLKGVNIQFFKKLFYAAKNGRRFCSIYTTVVDLAEGDFILQEEEVAAVKWVPLPELFERHERFPDEFTPSFHILIGLLKELQIKK